MELSQTGWNEKDKSEALWSVSCLPAERFQVEWVFGCLGLKADLPALFPPILASRRSLVVGSKLPITHAGLPRAQQEVEENQTVVEKVLFVLVAAKIRQEEDSHPTPSAMIP